jgi:hypothetical protein
MSVTFSRKKSGETYFWCNRRSLHLVNDLSHLLQVFKMCAIRIESTFTLGASRKRVDEEFSNTTRVNLEVKTSGDGVLP